MRLRRPQTDALSLVPGCTLGRAARGPRWPGRSAGALLHAGGPVEGGYRVIEVWQSREAADAFYTSDRYRAATTTITAQPNIVMTWPIEGLDTGTGWHPAP